MGAILIILVIFIDKRVFKRILRSSYKGPVQALQMRHNSLKLQQAVLNPTSTIGNYEERFELQRLNEEIKIQVEMLSKTFENSSKGKNSF